MTLERERAQRGGDQAGGAFLPPMCAPRVPYGGDSEAVPRARDERPQDLRQPTLGGPRQYTVFVESQGRGHGCALVYEQGEPMSVFDGTRELNPSEG